MGPYQFQGNFNSIGVGNNAPSYATPSGNYNSPAGPPIPSYATPSGNYNSPAGPPAPTSNPNPPPSPPAPTNKQFDWNAATRGQNVGDTFTGPDGKAYRVIDPGKGLAEPQRGDPSWADQNRAAAQQVEQANIAASQNEYDTLRAQLETQKPVIQGTYDTSNANLDAQLKQQQGLAGSATSQLQGQANIDTNSAYQNYQTAQAQNREMARSAGAGASSAYLNTQGQTMNQYNQTTGNIQLDLTNRMNDIQTNLQQINSQAAQAKNQLTTQYTAAMHNIVLDESASDFQKANAVHKIQADYSTQNAAISQQVAQMNNSLAIAKATVEYYAQMRGQNTTGFNPSTTVNSPSQPGDSTSSTNPIHGILSTDPTKQQNNPMLYTPNASMQSLLYPSTSQ